MNSSDNGEKFLTGCLLSPNDTFHTRIRSPLIELLAKGVPWQSPDHPSSFHCLLQTDGKALLRRRRRLHNALSIELVPTYSLQPRVVQEVLWTPKEKQTPSPAQTFGSTVISCLQNTREVAKQCLVGRLDSRSLQEEIGYMACTACVFKDLRPRVKPDTTV